MAPPFLFALPVHHHLYAEERRIRMFSGRAAES